MNSNLKNTNGTYSYQKKPVDGVPVVFQEKMYFMPIPQREIEKNPNLEQNPDW
jgi:starch-binding outer membrane protein, SusD/RagB family